ncbi:MAG: hypothetical protein K8S97_16310 [Anaerolineae bacterium]|nr:hypothetical protein [Anaerolineae bacterium]
MQQKCIGRIMWVALVCVVVIIPISPFPFLHAQEPDDCNEMIGFSRDGRTRMFVSVCDLQTQSRPLAPEYYGLGSLRVWKADAAFFWGPDGRYVVDADTQTSRLWTEMDCAWIADEVSPDGLYMVGREEEMLGEFEAQYWLTAVDTACNMQRLAGPFGPSNSGNSMSGPIWSPDGAYIVISVVRDGFDAAQWDLDLVSTDCLYDSAAECTQHMLEITDDSDVRLQYEQTYGHPPQTIIKSRDWDDPAWSPDGMQLAFSCLGGLCLLNRDGTDLRRIAVPNMGMGKKVWSPSGHYIAYRGSSANSSPYKKDVYLYDLETDTIIQVTDTPDFDEDGLMWLPMPDAEFLLAPPVE